MVGRAYVGQSRNPFPNLCGARSQTIGFGRIRLIPRPPISPPGADGGVDILAGRGSLGLDALRLCVQVKSQNSPSDVTVYRTLQGTMQTFKAEQGLLVCWGGVNKVVLVESRQSHFMVRLWDSRDLVRAIYRTYERLPAEIQAELPLTRVWMLVAEESSE